MQAKKRVLVVDDNIVNRTMLRRILIDSYSVYEAQNGEEAFEVLEQENGGIDAVLLDIVMPVMDGYEFLKKIRKIDKYVALPVVAVTQTNSDEAEIKALECGATDFATKPYKPVIIKQRLSNLLMLSESAAMRNTLENDNVSGVYNKDTFMKKAQEMMGKHPSVDYLLICADIVRFKIINDLFGTEEGNQLLHHIGEFFNDTLDKTTTVCGRLAADNFAICVPYYDGIEKNMTEKTEASLRQFHLDIKLSMCFGIYRVERPMIPVEQMCDRASLAIQSIKGKYQSVLVAYYSDEMRDKIIAEQEIINDMHDALRRGEFDIYIQPKFDLGDASLTGGESLVRWIHPTKGTIYPDEFIPIFEKNGFITLLDEYVWTKTCKKIREWKDKGIETVPISVNVSRIDIYNPNIVKIVSDIVRSYGLGPDDIELEITESAYTQNPVCLVDITNEFKKIGYKVAMDDFGKGYSSLNMLTEVPVDTIKLDMHFLQNDGKNKRSGNILNFIIGMAKWLRVPVVAEGIETKEQAALLHSMGCERGQGYYFSKPVTTDEFEKILKTGMKISSQTYNGDDFSIIDENELWEPDSKFNALFGSNAGALAIFEVKDKEIIMTRANEKFYELLGSGYENFFKTNPNVLDYIDSRERAEFEQKISAAIEKNSEIIASNHWTDAASGFDMVLRADLKVILKHSDRTLLLGTVEDMSQQARQDLIKQLDIDDILKNCDKAVGLCEFKQESLKPLYLNEGFYKMFSVPSEDCNLLELMGEVGSKKLAKLFLQASTQAKCFDEEFEYTKESNTRFYSFHAALVEHSTNIFPVFLCFVSDITQEKLEQNKCARTIEYMQRIYSDAPFGIEYFTFEKKPRLIGCNDAFMHICGYDDKEEFKEKHVFLGDLVSDRRSCNVGAIVKALDEYGKRIAFENKITCKDGTYRWVSGVYQRACDADGNGIIITYHNDITAAKDETESIKSSEQLYRIVSENMTARIFRYIPSEKVAIMISHKNGALHKFEYKNIPEKQIAEGLVSQRSVDDLRTFFKNADNGMQQMSTQLFVKSDKKKYSWFEFKFYNQFDKNGKPTQAICIMSDIDKRHRQERALYHAAHRDSLTGLYNRSAFKEHVCEHIKGNKKSLCAFMMADIDLFKTINDTRGHLAGDATLKHMSDILDDVFALNSLICRLGGDEFAVFMWNIEDEETAVELTRQVCREFEKSQAGTVTCSAGISFYPNDATSFDDLYLKADKALYKAKNNGKNMAVTYNSEEM